MPTTRVDLDTLKGRVIAAINAAAPGAFSIFLDADDDPRRSDEEIEKACFGADLTVCRLLAEDSTEGYRELFMTDSADLESGATLPARIGAIGAVKIKKLSGDSSYVAGHTDSGVSLADIERWRANAATLYGTSGAYSNAIYAIVGDEIFFTGHRAKVKVANVEPSDELQAPAPLEDVVLGLTLQSLIKEGDTGGAAPELRQTALQMMAARRGAATT